MSAIDELVSIWEERKENGTAVSPEEICRDCPELADELRWHIRALQAVESHFGVPTGSHNGSTTKHGSVPATIPSGPVRIATDYQIERLHASGGLGNVFLAVDPVLKRKVAIKFPKWKTLSPQQLARFEREARITGRLDHPGIVPVHSLKHDNGSSPCYVMRFVDGPTFAQTVQRVHGESKGPMTKAFFEQMDFRRLLQNFLAVCNIVGYAHGQGVVHRDVKPQNIVIGPFGETLLLDWGLAKVVDQSNAEDSRDVDLPNENRESMQTQTGMVCGTPAFASPEQLQGQNELVDFRSDIYSLGATLFYLLSGETSVQKSKVGDIMESFRQGRIFSVRERNPHVPRRLAAICQKAMAIDRDARYQTASELTRDLERYLAGDAVSAVVDPFWTRIARTLRRRPRLVAASLATCLMAIVAGLVGSALLNQKNRELVGSNDRLQSAVSESQLANRQALDALRSLVDDVVIRDLSEQKTLDHQERDFLNRILSQYIALAELQGESRENRAIRAEGLMQIGKIHLRLSDEEKALLDLQGAADEFQKLVDETDKLEYRLQLARTLTDWSEALLKSGQLKQANLRANSGIQILNEAATGIESATLSSPEIAYLYRILGIVQCRQRLWVDAKDSLERSRKHFEQLLTKDTLNAKYKLSLAMVFRHLSEVSGELGDLPNQILFSKDSLDLHSSLATQFPDQPEYQLGFAMALNNFSIQREFFGEIPAAIKEVSLAITIVEKLANRYESATQYRETWGVLLFRRSNLYRLSEDDKFEEPDLRQSIGLFQELVRVFPGNSDYLVQLLNPMHALAELKYRNGRLSDALAIEGELHVVAEQLQTKFPEVAKSSVSVTHAQKLRAILLRRQRRFAEALPVSLGVVSFLSEMAKSDSTASLEQLLLDAHIQLSRSLRSLPTGKDKSLEELKIAAELAERLEKANSKDFKVLSLIADGHNGLAYDYNSLKQADQAAFHRKRELEIREMVVAGFPDNPFYRIQLARSIFKQSYPLIMRDELIVARQNLDSAINLMETTKAEYPDDLLVSKTYGDCRANLGRWYYRQRRYKEALSEFKLGVDWNPSNDNRASHLVCWAILEPDNDQILVEVNSIIEGGIPSQRPLTNLLGGCGFALEKTTKPELASKYSDMAVHLLEYMVDDNYLPTDDSMRSLCSNPWHSKMRQRPEVMSLLEKLAFRNKELTGTSPPFPTKDTLIRDVRIWFSKRSLDELSIGTWLYRATAPRLEKAK